MCLAALALLAAAVGMVTSSASGQQGAGDIAPRGNAAPPVLIAYLGSTPTLDGNLSPGEWSDATAESGAGWGDHFNNVRAPEDLSLDLFVKHNGTHLFLALNVTDDVLYWYEGQHWVPKANPLVNAPNVTGWPWWGDDWEVLLNAGTLLDPANPGKTVAGNASSWQMAVNAHKGWFGEGQELGVPGIMPSEPRSVPGVWPTYIGWIDSGAQRAAAALHVGAGPYPGGSWYSVEWAVAFNPCVPVAPGVPWSPAAGPFSLGINIAVQDVDTPAAGSSNPFGLHHEVWWTSAGGSPTALSQFGTLILQPGPKQ